MTLERSLTSYEIEVAAAMTARRDSAQRLRDALDADLEGFADGIVAVREGRALDIFEPPYVGEVRQRMSEAILDFEATRHRFRLAMVALAMHDGRSAQEIGNAFRFSRQLASRYLKEARATWPALAGSADDGCDEAEVGAPVPGVVQGPVQVPPSSTN